MSDKIINSEDKIWVTIGGTINLGNYENVKIDMGQSRTIGPEDDPDELRMQICRKLITDFVVESDKIRNNLNTYHESKQDPSWAIDPTRRKRQV